MEIKESSVPVSNARRGGTDAIGGEVRCGNTATAPSWSSSQNDVIARHPPFRCLCPIHTRVRNAAFQIEITL